MCGLLRGEALLWLGNDLWDGCSITKSHEHLPASACTESWHSDEGRQGEQTSVCCQFIHQMWFTPVDFSAYVCVCVCVCLSTPFRHPNYLPPFREFDAKMCAVKWDSVGECVSSTSLALSRRGQRRMITPNRLHFFPCACVRWKVCHASNIVSDIWKCLLTVGALSSSHFNICLLTQTTKKVTRVTSDHIITKKLFFLYSTNLKTSSRVHLKLSIYTLYHNLQNLVLLGNKKRI